MIRQVVLGEKTSVDNKRTNNVPLRRVGTETVTCQYCHKIGHTADRCRFINNRQSMRQNFSNPVRTNFTPNRNFSSNNGNFAPNNRVNYNNTRISSSPSEGTLQTPGNAFPVVCRYCKKPGHVLENCRRRTFNNQFRDNQMQGNGQIPAKIGATPGNTITRPARIIATESTSNIEE